MVDVMNRISFAYANEAEAFPEVDPLVRPLGSRVMVQIRTPKKKTAGGIILSDDARDTEYWVVQVAKVLALGPVAFRDRKTLEPWPEGAWCNPGEYVRVPKFAGDNWTVKFGEGADDEARVVIYNDLDIIGVIPGGWEAAKAIKAFI